jgi:hypothetical protein
MKSFKRNMRVIKAEFFSVMNVIYGLGTRKNIPETEPNSSKRFQRGPDPQPYYEVSTFNCNIYTKKWLKNSRIEILSHERLILPGSSTKKKKLF